MTIIRFILNKKRNWQLDLFSSCLPHASALLWRPSKNGFMPSHRWPCFLPPVLILSSGKDFEPSLFFIFPFITLGALLILISCVSYRQRRTSNYYLWLVRNLAVANCFILLAIQEFPPAAISWYFSIASLAAGCILKNKNIDEIDSEHVQQEIAEIWLGLW